jgi:aspartate/methionine/tyrosine aminotransferase
MNPLLDQIAPSLIRALNAKKRPGDIDLGLGEPVLRPTMAPFEAATAWVAEHGCPYTPNAGTLALRHAIATHFAYPGLDTAEAVCVTVGSQEALYLGVKALCDPSTDEVLVVGPSYPAYPKIVQMEGVAVREVALSDATGFAPDAEAVLAAVGPKTRLILMASPANPTGRVWPRAELEKLAAGLLAREGDPVWVLADEVYRELVYTDAPYTSLASVYPHTLVANSLSKSNALTGLRLGWLMGPPAVMGAVVKAHQFVNTAASTYSQQVALAIFKTPGMLAEHRAHYAERSVAVAETLERHGFAFVAPEGAFYVMVRLPAGIESVGAAYRVLEEAHLVTVPGAAFGAEGWLRLSWVAEPAVFEEGIRRLAEFYAHAWGPEGRR